MISIIIPFHNEKENLPLLMEKLFKVLKKINVLWEIVLVDDGSTDGFESFCLKEKNIQKIVLVRHRKRLGKGEALKTGIENSKGEIIVFMDADLQDDPNDLPKFLDKINQGYDLVNGRRINRKDNFLVKFYSKIAQWFLKVFLHSPFSDINCGFKAFRRKVLEDFVFYGNNFRFFPLAVYYHGFKVTEVPVINHPRRYGVSKYGPLKLLGGMIDMLTAYFLFKFSEKPLHFFGKIGGLIFFAGLIINFYLTIERIFFKVLLYRRPILFLGILLILVGLQIIMTGILGELIVYLDKKSKSR